MQVTRRTLFSAGAISVAGLAVAGCGSNGGSATKHEAVKSDAVEIFPAKRDEVADGGTLRLTLNTYISNFNYFSNDGHDANTSAIFDCIWPALFVTTAQADVEPNPVYVKRADVLSESPLVVEVELQEGLKWSDGSPIDYQSVANRFDIGLGKKTGDYQVAGDEGYNQVEKVEQGANDRTCKVTFKEVYPDWRGLFVVMPNELAESPEAFNGAWRDKPAVTAGPFKIGAIDRTNKSVTLVRDENYPGEKAKLEKILFTTIEDPSAVATSFKNGQLDSIATLNPAIYTVVRDTVGKNAVIGKAAGPKWTHLTFNGAEGRPLHDKAVRQAFAHCVNRKEIFLSVNSVLPYPKDMIQLNNRMLMTNQDGYEDTSNGRGDFDPEKAKQILTDAGYTFDGEGRAVKDGKPIEVTYVYNDGSKTNETVIPIVQEGLKKAGITLKTQKVPPADLFSKYLIPGQFDVSLFTWNGNAYLASSSSIYRTDGRQNYGKIGSPEVDKLLKDVATKVERKDRVKALNEADSLEWDLLPNLPLWQAYTFQVQDKDLRNYGAFGFQSIKWEDVGFVKGSAKVK